MATQTQMTRAASHQSGILRQFMTVMEIHQTHLRLDINHLEVIVGCIAKSTDKEVVKYLPEANLSISNLRRCLSTIQAHWRMFQITLGSLDDA